LAAAFTLFLEDYRAHFPAQLQQMPPRAFILP
jgi:hypothetical protein